MKLADPYLTPGDWNRDPKVIAVRNVPTSAKRMVFTRYKIGLLRRPFYVIDHLVPLEIGGLNSIANLWPQPKSEAKLKDHLENYLRSQIAQGLLDRAQAVEFILNAWKAKTV